MAIKTPSNPGFFWGNFFFLPTAPSLKELPLWRGRFAKEFKGLKHFAMSWDTTASEFQLKSFAKFGFTVDNSFSLERSKPIPSKNNPLIVKEVRLKKDWDQIVDNYLESGGKQTPERKAFIQNLYRDYRKLIDKGLGRWFGVFKKTV